MCPRKSMKLDDRMQEQRRLEAIASYEQNLDPVIVADTMRSMSYE